MKPIRDTYEGVTYGQKVWMMIQACDKGNKQKEKGEEEGRKRRKGIMRHRNKGGEG